MSSAHEKGSDEFYLVSRDTGPYSVSIIPMMEIVGSMEEGLTVEEYEASSRTSIIAQPVSGYNGRSEEFDYNSKGITGFGNSEFLC